MTDAPDQQTESLATPLIDHYHPLIGDAQDSMYRAGSGLRVINEYLILHADEPTMPPVHESDLSNALEDGLRHLADLEEFLNDLDGMTNLLRWRRRFDFGEPRYQHPERCCSACGWGSIRTLADQALKQWEIQDREC